MSQTSKMQGSCCSRNFWDSEIRRLKSLHEFWFSMLESLDPWKFEIELIAQYCCKCTRPCEWAILIFNQSSFVCAVKAYPSVTRQGAITGSFFPCWDIQTSYTRMYPCSKAGLKHPRTTSEQNCFRMRSVTERSYFSCLFHLIMRTSF